MYKTLLFLVLVFVIACDKDKDNKYTELPDEIIRTTTCPTLHSRIMQLIPEKKNIKLLYPALFHDTVPKQITLTRTSDVYVTFVAESASYTNTFGWYSYQGTAIPNNISDVKINILFPNVSGIGEGGLLESGNMLKLGTDTFPKGTVIGFFIIVNGWRTNGTINMDFSKIFTNYELNTEHTQQHVLFKEVNCGDIVLGIEDISGSASDNDFNDILFTISDNKDGYESISFDTAKMPSL